MNGARFTTAVCAVVSAVLAVGDADAEGDDKLARGLDVFTQMPSQAPSGATLPVQIQAFGFPTVTKAVPLPLAKIEAAWDPRSLGPASVAPGSVEVTADASAMHKVATGRAPRRWPSCARSWRRPSTTARPRRSR
jgi:hypothetical protein